MKLHTRTFSKDFPGYHGKLFAGYFFCSENKPRRGALEALAFGQPWHWVTCATVESGDWPRNNDIRIRNLVWTPGGHAHKARTSAEGWPGRTTPLAWPLHPCCT